MSQASLLQRLIHTLATAGIAGGLVALSPQVLAEETAAPKAESEAPIQLTFSSNQSRDMFHVMAGELYLKNGQIKEALEHYSAAARDTKDPKIAETAAMLAIQLGDNASAEQFVNQWSGSNVDSFDIRQSRAIVRARSGQYDKALDDVVWLRDFMDKKEGHGFEYVISTLTLEAGIDASLGVFKRYAEKIDKSPLVQLTVANLAMNAEQFDDALAFAKKAAAIGTDSDKEQAAHIRAKVLIAQEKPKEAVAELEPYIAKTKDNDIKLDYARSLVVLDRRSDAMPIFKQLSEVDPDDDSVTYTLGLLYLEQKDYTFAEPLFKKLLALPNRKPDANYFLGQVYEGEKKNAEAINAYQQAMPNSTFANEAAARAATLLVKEKNLDSALSWLDEQLKNLALNDARQADLLLIKAQLLQDAERYPDALVILNKANELRSNHPDTLYQRSLVLEKTGDVKGAEADLRAILKVAPDNSPALNALGYLLTVNTDRYTEAQELIKKAAKLSPDDPAVMDSLGWVAFKLNDLAEAETQLRKAFKLFVDPEVASHLAQVLSARGKVDEAKKLLQDMLVKFPNNKLLVEANKKVVGLK